MLKYANMPLKYTGVTIFHELIYVRCTLFCNDCGFELPKNALTCPNCGRPTDLNYAEQATSVLPALDAEEEIYNDNAHSNLIQDDEYVYYGSEQYHGGEQAATSLAQRDYWIDDEEDDALFVEPPTSSRKKWPAIVVLAVLIVAFVIVAYYFLTKDSRVLSASDRLVTAIEANDGKQIVEILQADAPQDDETKKIIAEYPDLNEINISPFMELLQDKTYKESIIKALKEKRNSDFVIIPAKDGYPETVYMQAYGIDIVSTVAPLKIQSAVLDSPIEKKVAGSTELFPLYPGDYSFSFSYPQANVERSFTQEIRLTWDDANIKDDKYVLNVSDNLVQVTLPNQFPAAMILIDGKPIQKTVGEVIKGGGSLGDYVKGTAISLSLTVNDYELISNSIVLNSDNQKLDFVFRDAEIAESTDPDAEVFVDGQPAGVLADYVDYGYIIGKRGSGAKYEVMVDGENVQTSSASLSAPSTTTASTEDNKTDDEESEVTTTKPTEETEKTETTTTGHSGQDSDSTTASTTTVPQQTTQSPTTTTAPPERLSSRYSNAEVNDAKNNKLSSQMKYDILASIGTYVREDALAAKTHNASLYSTLGNPQLGVHQSWIAELIANNIVHTYVPTQSAIWNDSWQVSVNDGKLYARVTETYYYNLTTVQNGTTIHDNEALADNWIHHLYFDEGRGKWIIYKNESTSGSSSNVDRYGY